MEEKELIRELAEELEKTSKIASLVTIREIISGGDDIIDASGLNPWCMNEGLATGDETLDFRNAEALIKQAKEYTKNAISEEEGRR